MSRSDLPTLDTVLSSQDQGGSNWPEEIHYNKANAALEILFEDNQRASLTAEFLRVCSPSAEARGHSAASAPPPATGKKDIAITAIDPVGDYAIKLTFSDGHDSGIYSWTYLFGLATKQETIWQEYLTFLETVETQKQ